MRNINFLSVVIPAYKQEKTIINDINILYNVLSKLPYKFEIIVVVDGYLDDTFRNARKINKDNVRVFGYERNQGKGHAVRYGMLKGKGDVIGFIDAGMDVQPAGISILLDSMVWRNADIIIGSKLHPESKRINYPIFRKILSWGYRTLTHVLFGFNVRDTQVGLKFFRRNVVEGVFPKLLVKTFAFDVEILALANSLGFKKIYEGPVELNFNGGSSITSKNFWIIIFSMLWDTIAVFYRLKILKYYDNIKNEKKLISLAFKHPLISGSSIVFVGSMLTSVLNYFFNLGMGRLLTVSDYGTFASLMSIFNIFSVLSLTIVMVFAKFSASLISRKEGYLVKQLFNKGSLWVSEISLVICGMIIIFSLQISHFLNINDLFLVNITSATLFFAFLSSVGMGILQGALKFISLSTVNILSSFTKLVIGFMLVLKLKVAGAMGAFFISSVLSYAFVFISVYLIAKGRSSSSVHIPNLRKSLSMYAIPVFLSTLGVTALITMDIILVKHFFTPEIAGRYAALSLMGRSIFYVVAPITTVLFPLMVQKKERQEKLFGTFFLSIVLIGLPSIILSIVYFVIPGFVIHIFFPANEYKSLASLMGPFSLFVLFYALSYLLSNFYLSIGKTKAFLFTIIGTFFEIMFIIFVHQTISQVVNGLVVISFLLLFSLLLYYRNATKQT